MSEKEKIEMLEELFEVEEGTLKAETKLEDVPEFDSMTRLSLIVMMEDEFGVKLESETIKKFVTVNDILNLMNK